MTELGWGGKHRQREQQRKHFWVSAAAHTAAGSKPNCTLLLTYRDSDTERDSASALFGEEKFVTYDRIDKNGCLLTTVHEDSKVFSST